MLAQGVGCRIIALILAISQRTGIDPRTIADLVQGKHADVFALIVGEGYRDAFDATKA